MDPERLKKLGLPPNATQEQVDQRLDDLAADSFEKDEIQKKLTAATAAMATVEAERKAEKEKALAAERTALDEDARGRGLWEPGSKRQLHFMSLDIETAKTFIGLLDPQNPVGATLQATGDNTAAAVKEGTLESTLRADYGQIWGVHDLSMSTFKHAMAQLGVTDEMLKEYGPEAIVKKQMLHQDDWSKGLRGEK